MLNRVAGLFPLAIRIGLGRRFVPAPGRSLRRSNLCRRATRKQARSKHANHQFYFHNFTFR